MHVVPPAPKFQSDCCELFVWLLMLSFILFQDKWEIVVRWLWGM